MKIADFGAAKLFDQNGKLKTVIGTPGTMAPEVQSGRRYKAREADMFSLGCILFMLATRMPVTEGECRENDSVYKYISKRQPEKFWQNREIFAKRYRVDFKISKCLRTLIDGLICADPDMRLSMSGAIGHPWMEGPCAS